ncbi:hypothetical protein C8034_v002713 [Colletotrichum sidae]|uniref:F-box domain-containing protein n=1 Tax=Colletotrichum sidae TaxID=1347389 RepID=A0A4R8TCD7_9PEZI|nr:hypothetical protein C8034_v002713 [Colletotrichum sidae]
MEPATGTTESATGLFAKLSPELMNMVVDHLGPTAQCSLALTCHRLHDEYFRGTGDRSRRRMARLLERDLPDYYYCLDCEKLHNWRRPWTAAVQAAEEDRREVTGPTAPSDQVSEAPRQWRGVKAECCPDRSTKPDSHYGPCPTSVWHHPGGTYFFGCHDVHLMILHERHGRLGPPSYYLDGTRFFTRGDVHLMSSWTATVENESLTIRISHQISGPSDFMVKWFLRSTAAKAVAVCQHRSVEDVARWGTERGLKGRWKYICKTCNQWFRVSSSKLDEGWVQVKMKAKETHRPCSVIGHGFDTTGEEGPWRH